MLILDGLDYLRAETKSIRNDVTEIKISVAQLKERAGLWGALGGLIGGAVISAIVAKWIG